MDETELTTMTEEMKQVAAEHDKKLEDWENGDRERVIHLSETVDGLRRLMNDKLTDINLWAKEMSDEAERIRDKVDIKIAMKYITIYRYLNYVTHDEVVEHAADPFELAHFLRAKYIEWHDIRISASFPDSVIGADKIMATTRKRYTSTVPFKEGFPECDN